MRAKCIFFNKAVPDALQDLLGRRHVAWILMLQATSRRRRHDDVSTCLEIDLSDFIMVADDRL
jgi:hypothetical protein